MKALSIRQPWAFLIVHCGKDVENRRWPTHYRGPILIHSALGMTIREFWEAHDFVTYNVRTDVDGAQTFPTPEGLKRGGIIGQAELVDCVRKSDSPWFVGPWGFVLKNPKPLPFMPCKGALGIFEIDYPSSPPRVQGGC